MCPRFPLHSPNPSPFHNAPKVAPAAGGGGGLSIPRWDHFTLAVKQRKILVKENLWSNVFTSMLMSISIHRQSLCLFAQLCSMTLVSHLLRWMTCVPGHPLRVHRTMYTSNSLSIGKLTTHAYTLDNFNMIFIIPLVLLVLHYIIRMPSYLKILKENTCKHLH
jgi:hypothetical protein